MKIFEELVRELLGNREKVLVTHLKSQRGMVDRDLIRYLTDYPNVDIQREDKQREDIQREDIQKEDKQKDDTHILSKYKIEDTGDIYINEPFFPKERLIILGGGHIALPLSEFAAKTGFYVVIGDDRPIFANKQRFPFAKEVYCDSFENIINQVNITKSDYIVIITRGHRHDMDCLRQLLSGEESKYLGMIGSRRRVKAVLEILEEEGYEKTRLEQICTPIGLSIGAATPEEISISILAELILCKRGTDKGSHILFKQGDVDFYVLEILAKSKEPMCLVTVIDTKGSTPRGVGAKMVVYPTGHVKGSIGGGCSEAEVIHRAVKMIGTKSYEVFTIDMTGDVAESEGMVCGGIMEVLIEDF